MADHKSPLGCPGGNSDLHSKTEDIFFISTMLLHVAEQWVGGEGGGSVPGDAAADTPH